ncbi:DUF1501 domain-containing protein [Hymenobacter aerilatus]|uniref:DUF1501 domain-containing protein n=1 Tax=Hymenobacter aerilatus TaxID=2932251 RepID=A0A8T9SYG6_9BACT|nr:DUF1501 domain-containing protein [Hymenobacter aerilatus]UOR05260.1 DUF1501 domain-containing protein [Hymenobacter aerilatus]
MALHIPFAQAGVQQVPRTTGPILQQAGNLNNTLLMTFSEFGRRVSQNASNGTANNVLLLGGGLKKQGILNDAPNLQDFN